ncbi:hypothetical protein EMPS_09096 [Entomortierella parvispora]|uniref:Uncharacterized protein n=1 Tax=Entomortierella parvispora TaxID=205924 RepID=A0A9P3HHJ6_9FUNG|nr:hypothetical protein EMPS_09096 [Entomortierella parvispora]
MRPVTAVSDFSAKMSKHFHYSSVMPLSEANLSKHTLQSPPSREAKLKHILVYVDLQRELIEVEEELYRTMTEQNRLAKTVSAKQKQQQQQLERLEQQQKLQQQGQQSNKPQAHGNQQEPEADEIVGKDESALDEEETDENEAEHEHEHEPISSSAPQMVSPHVVVDGSVVSPFNVALASTHSQQQQQQQRQGQQTDQPKHQQHVVINTSARRHKRSSTIPDAAFDPSLALPRALPRSTPLVYRDSFYSGEPEGEGEGDPDSPTLPYHTLEPKFSSFEENIGYSLTRVQSREERQHRPAFRNHPQQSSTTTATLGGGARPVQYRRRTEDSSTADPHQVGSQLGLALTRTTQTQPAREKEKKSGGILSRFSFLGRKQQQQESGQQVHPHHPRHESAPGTTRVGNSSTVAAGHPTELTPFHSLNYNDGETFRDDSVIQGPTKRRSKVKALFQDLFKKSSAAPSGKAGLRRFEDQEPLQPPKMRGEDTHKKRYPGSGHGILSSGAIIVQREDIPPRAATSLSHYGRDQQEETQQRRREQRESMVDPALQLAQLQHQSSGSRPSEEEGGRVGQFITTYPQYEEIYITHEEQQRNSNSVHTPFAGFVQASLTPPPPLSVARHSTTSFSSSNRHPTVGQILSTRDEHEGSADVESKRHLEPEEEEEQEEQQGGQEAKNEAEHDDDEDSGLESSQNLAQKTRPSSNLLPLAGAIKEMMKNSNTNDHYDDTHDLSSPYDTYTNNSSNQPNLNSNGAHANGNQPRRMMALTPEQHADLDEVGIRQDTYGLASA